ncbi:Ctk2p NDAI_0C03700 [Naumovozyma dairenensis CBS 421]|uniref:Cyclin-like domain-containing protein n=1 Tax=Naumovozyma dairenensis (strain ATCC 10597 / BCRC 20456 / CBS 421 / NBRC 0211 / NRRL Y-12639) TaxID=1071378 RepID=G0W8B9_NAUDC|nr:hypothetical protein NDAI_0C03700 [Naumovozyma dairenensis CBS 421]CCD24030.1 hypothetical protein NDAI_0C03700 [Naumovozyma dairenensis CBS 421]
MSPGTTTTTSRPGTSSSSSPSSSSLASFESELYLSRPYFTRRQISKLQSKTITDHRSYNSKKLTIVRYLSDLCVHLSFPRKTLETAIYYYQRYHLFHPFETELTYTLALGCLILSCKQVETITKINDIVNLSFVLRNGKPLPMTSPSSAVELENMKKRIFNLELKVLKSCSFDYRINNYIHIDEFIIKFGQKLNFHFQICHLAWIIEYDVFKLDLLLIIPQHVIALATLKLATELYGQDLEIWNKLETFTNLQVEKLSFKQAYFDILNFYINTFDLCDLKDNLPTDVPPISINEFMALKKRAGSEVGLEDITNNTSKFQQEIVDADPYLNINQNEFKMAREKRYVLSQDLIEQEVISLKK